MNLAPTADFRAWEATAIVRIGAFDYRLLVPTTRKRHLPIAIQVSSELLYKLLVLRIDEAPADITFLKTCNDRQADAIREYERTIQTLRMDLTAREDQLQDAQRRLCECGEQLAATRALAQTERASADFHKQRYEQMAAAIREVVNPSDFKAAWQKAFSAIRNALALWGYHRREVHPWYSRDRWFGCKNCVPEWQLCEVQFFDYNEARTAEEIVAAVYRNVAETLHPALTGEKGE